MYTLKDFERDCISLECEEVVSYVIDDTHILTAIGYEDCINIELNLGSVVDGVCILDELLENCCVDREDESEIPWAIDYLKNCI